MNGVFKGIRNLPITALVRSTYYRLASLFATRGERWSTVLTSSRVFSESIMKLMKEDTIRASTHVVTVFDCHSQTFSVQKIMDHSEGRPNFSYVVRLNRCWCDYGKYQAFRVPCSHVIAACAHARQDAYGYLSDVYKAINVMNVYNEGFAVLPMEDYWSPYQGNIVWHNDDMRRNKKGRPNNKRIRIEMDTTDKMIRLCSICRQPGHNRKKCLNVGGTSAS
ncbi:unnamed protein product [Lathyrus sativus]|nr:unnamed protein product [Lathyrus sativus]